MSYVRKRPKTQYVEFEFMNLRTGRTVAYADTLHDVLAMANDYRADPDLLVIGIDDRGRQANSWPLDHVLSGIFERDLAV